MAHLEELLPNFIKGAKIRKKYWDKNQYLYFKDDNIMTNNDVCVSLNGLDFAADWEFYNEPAIDWNYIIKSKCLCWFGVVGKEKQRIGIVSAIANYIDSRTYYIDKDTGFSACHPVRKDEVTFYEDKKDD